MTLLSLHPSLVDQAYQAMLREIADGSLAPNTHLVQEVLAARYGVSRHPIQQALLLLKSDGLVQDAGRRGLIVAPLDIAMMQQRYQIRAVLDGLAARLAARRCAGSPQVAARARREGDRIVRGGLRAVAAGDVNDMIAHDVAFHAFVYDASGNPMIGPTAQLHWRFLRRVMGEVLRAAAPPPSIWQQHRDILDAIVTGDEAAAESRTLRHIESAADRLASNAERTNKQNNQEDTSNGPNRRRAR